MTSISIKDIANIITHDFLVKDVLVVMYITILKQGIEFIYKSGCSTDLNTLIKYYMFKWLMSYVLLVE